MSTKLFSIIILIFLTSSSLAIFSNDIKSEQISKINSFETSLDNEYLEAIVSETLKSFQSGFVKNKGQINNQIHYYIQSQEFMVGFKENEVEFYHLADGINTKFTLKLIDSNVVIPVGVKPNQIKTNYFIGQDRTKWINTENYEEVIYKNIYDNIDLVYKTLDGDLKYEFYVNPGGVVKDIKIQWDGSMELNLNDNEINVFLNTNSGTIKIKDSGLLITQSNEKIEGSFISYQDDTYGFDIPSYNQGELLVIDPVVDLDFSTYVSGGNNDKAQSIILDSQGNIYVTGTARSVDFPTTTGVVNETGDGNVNSEDIFIFKLSNDGTTLLISTYIVGSNVDNANDIGMDNSGNIFIVGHTVSDDFPTTSGAYNETGDENTSRNDIIVVKLNSDLDTLIYSTYLAGTNEDNGFKLIVDASGSVYIFGMSNSGDYPTTSGVINTTNNGVIGSLDLVITKLSIDGSSLIFSTYFGGTGTEWSRDLHLDASDNIIIYGETDSTDYPTSSGAYNTSSNGVRDLVVTKLTPDATGIVFSTYVGGTGNDFGYSMDIDSIGNIYFTGVTGSTNYPTTPGAYDEVGDGTTNGDGFITKLSVNGDNLLSSTYLGGTNIDRVNDIIVDDVNVYVTGSTGAPDFPTTSDALDAVGEASSTYSDVFISVLSIDLNNLQYSTYVSGGFADWSSALFVDSGDIYVAGYTFSVDFVTTINAYDTIGDNNTGRRDVFVLKLEISNLPLNITLGVAGDSQAYLEWENNVNDWDYLNTYRIFRSSVQGGPYVNVANTTALSYTDPGLTNGNPYYYVINVTNNFGESSTSNEISIIPSLVPASPQNLIGIMVGFNLQLNWSVIDETGIINYNVYRSTSSGGLYGSIANVTTKYFTDTTTVLGTTYYYVVTAINAAGESVFSNEISFTSIEAPDEPINVQLVISGSLIINWTEPSYTGYSPILFYEILRSLTQGSSYVSIANTTATTFIDGLTNLGVTYYYVLRAHNLAGFSILSSEVSGVGTGINIVIPSAPLQFFMTIGNHVLHLSWSDPSFLGATSIIGFNIYRSTTSGGSYILLTNTFSYLFDDDRVTNGIRYYYVITALNSGGESVYSVEISGVPGSNQQSPQNLIANPGNHQIELSWNIPQNQVETIIHYIIYRAEGSIGPFYILTNTTAISFIDTNVTLSVNYYYVVTLVTINGESLVSNMVKSFAASLPFAPSMFSGTEGNNLASFTWVQSDGRGVEILGYKLYRSDISGSEFELITSTTALSFADATVFNNNTYYYVVTSFNIIGESSYSVELRIILVGDPLTFTDESPINIIFMLIPLFIARLIKRRNLR